MSATSKHPDSRQPNRLIGETSPYLRQHAFNPVDWYPWGNEAITFARTSDKPIFLSIGYSACHWCHVMERESFEDAETAAVMNEHFVNIKVDREERPDLDSIYMSAVQLMTMHGGWPMSVWLTPDLLPFYGGTYFPPVARHGLPSFRNLLRHLADAWKNRRAEIADVTKNMHDRMQEIGTIKASTGEPTVGLLVRAGEHLMQRFDALHGGFGHAPKFPHSVECRLLFQAGRLARHQHMMDAGLLSLERMILGGIYDQLGGGFHRYSTDRQWLVPHFEKMLYDNALILRACSEAYQLTHREVFARCIRETADYILREMTDPCGAFYSTQDADSEGEEGKFFVWSHQEIVTELGADAEVFCRAYDVTPAGNWEGKNILHRPRPWEEIARALRMSLSEFEKIVSRCKSRLFAVRERRIRPGRDEKILTAWNGMMIDALASLEHLIPGTSYLDQARQAAIWLLEKMRTPHGRLLRTNRKSQAPILGYLEDYAYLSHGLISVFEASSDPSFLESASEIVDAMIDLFWDERDGGFFFTGNDHEKLIVRTKDPHDGAIPSGNAMAVTAMARLALLTQRSDLSDRVERTLRLFHSLMVDQPMATAQMLLALRLHMGPSIQLGVLGVPGSQELEHVLATVHGTWMPNKVLALGDLRESENTRKIPLLHGKQPVEPLSIYVCHQFTCDAPMHDPAEFAMAWEQLATGTQL